VKVIQTTEAQADALRATIDAALLLPSRGTTVGPFAFVPQVAWNGVGVTPVGWTKTYADEYVLSASDAWLPCEDHILPIVAASAAVSAGNKASFASAAATRPDVPDVTQAGTRTPKDKASVANVTTEAEEKAP
jgi:hypothetical protein